MSEEVTEGGFLQPKDAWDALSLEGNTKDAKSGK